MRQRYDPGNDALFGDGWTTRAISPIVERVLAELSPHVSRDVRPGGRWDSGWIRRLCAFLGGRELLRSNSTVIGASRMALDTFRRQLYGLRLPSGFGSEGDRLDLGNIG